MMIPWRGVKSKLLPLVVGFLFGVNIRHLHHHIEEKELGSKENKVVGAMPSSSSCRKQKMFRQDYWGMGQSLSSSSQVPGGSAFDLDKREPPSEAELIQKLEASQGQAGGGNMPLQFLYHHLPWAEEDQPQSEWVQDCFDTLLLDNDLP